MTVPNGLMRANVYPGQVSPLPNPFLYTLPQELWDKTKTAFYYTANFVPLALSASQSVQTNVQNDAAFIIVAATAVVTDTADTTRLTFVPQLVQILDQTSGANFFDAPTHFHNVYGTAEQPAFWPLPRLVLPGATLTTTLQNLEATARNVRIAYLGFKVYNSVAG